VTDAISFTDLHAFQRDLLYVVRALECAGGQPKGLVVAAELEATYCEKLADSRLYDNLDALADRGLLARDQQDDGTDEYRTTRAGRRLVERHVERRADHLGFAVAKREDA